MSRFEEDLLDPEVKKVMNMMAEIIDLIPRLAQEYPEILNCNLFKELLDRRDQLTNHMKNKTQEMLDKNSQALNKLQNGKKNNLN
jgi:phosphopantothenate synthetase